MDLLSEIENLSSSLREFSEQILKMWEAGRPIKDIEFEKLKGILIESDHIKRIIENICKKIEEYSYTGIYCIVGEAGSGKTQIALFALKELEKMKPDIKTYYYRIVDQNSINKINELFENLRGKNVVFIDEIDSLLGSVDEEERKKIVEKLGNILIRYAEEPIDDKTIAVVLLLNRRSYDLVKKDERLSRRIIVQNIPSDYENLPKEKLLSLMKRILALVYSTKRDLFPRDYVSHVLKMLYEWGNCYIEWLIATASVGTYVKTLLKAYITILENLRREDFGFLSETEEGNEIENVFKELINKYLKRIEFEIDGSKFVAEIIKMEGQGPDLCYKIYPGVIPSGKSVRKVNIEIKSGYYVSLMRKKSQLINYASLATLMLIWIFKGERSRVEDLVEEIEKNAPNPVDYIAIPYELIRPAIYLKNPLDFLIEMRIKEDLEAKIQKSLRYIEVLPRVMKKEMPEVEDLPERCRDIAVVLIHRLKPDEKDGKQIQVGRVKNYLKEILRGYGFQLNDKEIESIAINILQNLEKQGFLSKQSEKIFYSKLQAWKGRGGEGVELAAEVLVDMLKKVPLS